MITLKLKSNKCTLFKSSQNIKNDLITIIEKNSTFIGGYVHLKIIIKKKMEWNMFKIHFLINRKPHLSSCVPSFKYIKNNF